MDIIVDIKFLPWIERDAQGGVTHHFGEVPDLHLIRMLGIEAAVRSKLSTGIRINPKPN